MKASVIFFLASALFIYGPVSATAEITGELELTGSDLRQQAAPGETIEFTFNVRNHADSARTVYLAYSDFHGWAISCPDQASAPANDKVRVTLSVRLPTNGTAINDFITVTATAGEDVATLELFARRTWFTGAEAPVDILLATAIFDPDNNVFWSVGGNNNEDLIYGVMSYNPATDAWEDDYAQPVESATGGGVCLLNGRIYMVGGYKDDFETLTNAMQIYDIASDQWTMGAPMDDESGLLTPGCVCDPDRDRVWIVGGMNGGFIPTMKVQYYDINENEWTSSGLARFLHPFWSVRAIYHKNTIRVVSLSNISFYDIEANDWHDDIALPYDRIETAYDHFGEYEYMVGGWKFGPIGDIASDYSVIYRSIESGGDWAFDTLLLPKALGPTSGAFDDQGRFFMFGGLQAGYGRGDILSDVFEYPVIEGLPDDHYADETPETVMGYDDGDPEVEFYINCTPCSLVQGFQPKLYPVRLLDFSWRNGDSPDSYPYTPHRLVVYYDEVADGIPQSDVPIFRSDLIGIGESNSWNTVDLSYVAELQGPIESGEVFIGFEYVNPNSVRPYIGFDADSAPVDRIWYKIDGTWESSMSHGKVGVMLMRAGVEFIGEMPDDDSDDDTASPDDDSNDDPPDLDDDNDEGDDDDAQPDDGNAENASNDDDNGDGACCW